MIKKLEQKQENTINIISLKVISIERDLFS